MPPNFRLMWNLMACGTAMVRESHRRMCQEFECGPTDFLMLVCDGISEGSVRVVL